MKDERFVNMDENLRTIDLKRKGKLKMGQTIGVEPFDKHIQLKKGELTIIAGHANAGKTTVILWYMLVNAVKNDTRWLVYSSENDAWILIDKIISMKLQRHTEDVSDKDFYMARDYVLDHFRFIDDTKTYTAYQLLDLAREIKDEWDYQALLLDPYNSIAKDRKMFAELGGHEYDYRVLGDIRIFCKQTGIAVYINAHGVTEALRKVHTRGDEYMNYELDGHPRPLAQADIEGGSKFSSRADNFWCVHRYTRHESLYNYTLIHVNKIKVTETGGSPTFFNDPVRLQMRMGGTFLIDDRFDPLGQLHRTEEHITTSNEDDIF